MHLTYTDRCRFLNCSVRMGGGDVDGFVMNSEGIPGMREGGRGALWIITDLLWTGVGALWIHNAPVPVPHPHLHPSYSPPPTPTLPPLLFSPSDSSPFINHLWMVVPCFLHTNVHFLLSSGSDLLAQLAAATPLDSNYGLWGAQGWQVCELKEHRSEKHQGSLLLLSSTDSWLLSIVTYSYCKCTALPRVKFLSNPRRMHSKE
jgi:hypothetical protein